MLSASPLLASVRMVVQLDEVRRQLASRAGHRPVREYLERFDESRRPGMLLLADIIPPQPPGGIPA
ncbi:hypothetical protein [Streptomyces bohaiensis]|uniref:Uncharacterized protein n=1 Tax=Streptomyces bohaiensis TaxID=1431344 RepID=A0ABX1C942_9ACTN|nr:hypothetical protein [Streptomyces bohaiensis]NJQ14125.1 hypothetical protein [Streptomyces bohaiensis]